MIPNARLILGPPGCGKTTTLIRIVEEKLAEGVHPSRIGIVSFTTKAVREFLSRACAKFNLTPKDFPHCRTLHATGYHALGLQTTDVMGSADYRKVGDMLGLVMEGQERAHGEDGIAVPTVLGSGSKYLSLIMLSTYRQSSLEWEYNYAGNYNIHFSKLVQVKAQLQEYKAKYNKYDFADMIYRYVQIAEPPYLDLLIVDEAQDLTPLQWRMVEKMAERATEVVIAGDDDQAIHRWAAADVGEFMRCASHVEVLSQSYRLPRAVWELARRISKRIPDRMEKEFLPRDEEGEVHRVWRLEQMPIQRGSWTIMARTNAFVDDFANVLRKHGFFYSRNGRWSIDQTSLEVMATWHDLIDGQALNIGRIKTFYENVPKMGKNPVVKRGATKLLDAADPEQGLTYEDLVARFGLLAPRDADPMDVARLSEYDKVYVRAIRRRGEDIYKEPRIKISTIHAMKGGEDDNVAVYTGSTKACVEGKHPEDEHRVFYVAVTRTRKALFIIESDKKHRYYL